MMFLQILQLSDDLTGVGGLENVAAADQYVNAGFDQSWRRLVLDTSVDFDERRSSR